jgi:hypothetical protein
MAFTGTIDTRGTNNNTTNYGSTKIFGLPGRCTPAGALNTGHAGSGGYGTPLQIENKHWAHPVC